MNTYYLDQMASAIHLNDYTPLKDLIDAHIATTGGLTDEEADYVFSKADELKQKENSSS